jgi:hypothetical protein
VFKTFIYALLLFFGTCVLAQKSDSSLTVLKTAEWELKAIEKGFLSRNESERIEANKKFIEVWDRIAGDPQILHYNFDSLKEVSILSPKDKKFKLITWNLHKNDGTHAFFGYLLVDNRKRVKKGFLRHETIETYEHFKLIDNSAIIKNPETYVGTPEKWFGMLYYSMIECDGYYTLLGYDPNDKLTQRKFVDALYFKPDGTPVFGKDIFRFPKKNPRRLMFEYSSEVSMSLKWNEKREQIVFSHLAPAKEGDVLKDQPQYYGPDGSYDALELKKDKWIMLEDVDVRNEKNDNDRSWNDPKKPSNKKHKKVMPGNRVDNKKQKSGKPD